MPPILHDDSTFPWFNSKYAGYKMKDIPAEYLMWLVENDKAHGDVGNYIARNLETIKQEIKQKIKK